MLFFLPQTSLVLQENTVLSFGQRRKEVRKFVFTEVVSKPMQNLPRLSSQARVIFLLAAWELLFQTLHPHEH